MRQATLVFVLALIALTNAGRAGPASDVLSLRALLIERLGLMQQVAAYKWNNKLPINDPVREANVLKAALARSRAAGLDLDVARRFIVAQMEAAKIVQRRYFETWREEDVGTVPGVPDLASELRPKIGALSGDLIAAMAGNRERLRSCSAVSVLRPVPPVLSSVPRAWEVAIGGVLGEGFDCPQGP